MEFLKAFYKVFPCCVSNSTSVVKYDEQRLGMFACLFLGTFFTAHAQNQPKQLQSSIQDYTQLFKNFNMACHG